METDQYPLYFCIGEYLKLKYQKFKQKYPIDNCNILNANIILNPKDLEKLLCSIVEIYKIQYKEFEHNFESEFKDNINSKVFLK